MFNWPHYRESNGRSGMKSSCRPFIGNIILVTISVLLALAMSEGAARIVMHPDVAENYMLLREYDPLLGWRKIANAHKRVRTAEYDIEEQINSKNLRDREYDYSKPVGTTRILILGDSFTEGYT